MITKRTAGTQAAANWSQVTYFRVYKAGVNTQHSEAYVFANLRQQCVIVVKFVVADSKGNPVIPTPGSVSLTLVNDSNSYIDQFPDWEVRQQANEYTWNESVAQQTAAMAAGEDDIVASNEADPDETESSAYDNIVTYYVSTSAKLATKIAGRITSADESYSVTTLSELENDQGGLGDGQGRFGSWVIARPVPQPSFDIEAYGDKFQNDHHKLHDYPLDGTYPGDRSYEQVINVRYRNSIVDLIRFKTASGADRLSLWADAGEATGGAEWSFTYSVQPGSNERLLGWDQAGYITPWKYVGTFVGGVSLEECRVRNASRTIHGGKKSVVIGMVMGNKHEQFTDFKPGVGHVIRADKRSDIIVITDEYGNDHRLRVYIDNGNELNWVHIAKA